MSASQLQAFFADEATVLCIKNLKYLISLSFIKLCSFTNWTEVKRLRAEFFLGAVNLFQKFQAIIGEDKSSWESSIERYKH